MDSSQSAIIQVVKREMQARPSEQHKRMAQWWPHSKGTLLEPRTAIQPAYSGRKQRAPLPERSRFGNLARCFIGFRHREQLLVESIPSAGCSVRTREGAFSYTLATSDALADVNAA